MKSRVRLLDNIMGYIVKRKGKQMRPMLVFLSASLHGTIDEKTHRGAALVELLHTATLVHDDVVDEAAYRRGFFSINALWKNKVAVLVGDYLLSRGLLLSIDNGDFELLKLVSQAVREMSEGELLQMEKSRLLDITEEVYYDIIRQKTAALFAACCGVGAASVNAPVKEVEKMVKMGELMGMAFQIKDDLFDYGDAEIGKPRGIDIKEKKMTLPLIAALAESEKSERKRILNIIRKESHKPKKVAEVIAFVKETGGLAYAEKVMISYQQQAEQLLDQFPEGDSRESLRQLIGFVISRKK